MSLRKTIASHLSGKFPADPQRLLSELNAQLKPPMDVDLLRLRAAAYIHMKPSLFVPCDTGEFVEPAAARQVSHVDAALRDALHILDNCTGKSAHTVAERQQAALIAAYSAFLLRNLPLAEELMARAEREGYAIAERPAALLRSQILFEQGQFSRCVELLKGVLASTPQESPEYEKIFANLVAACAKGRLDFPDSEWMDKSAAARYNAAASLVPTLEQFRKGDLLAVLKDHPETGLSAERLSEILAIVTEEQLALGELLEEALRQLDSASSHLKQQLEKTVPLTDDHGARQSPSQLLDRARLLEAGHFIQALGTYARARQAALCSGITSSEPLPAGTDAAPHLRKFVRSVNRLTAHPYYRRRLPGPLKTLLRVAQKASLRRERHRRASMSKMTPAQRLSAKSTAVSQRVRESRSKNAKALLKLKMQLREAVAQQQAASADAMELDQAGGKNAVPAGFVRHPTGAFALDSLASGPTFVSRPTLDPERWFPPHLRTRRGGAAGTRGARKAAVQATGYATSQGSTQVDTKLSMASAPASSSTSSSGGSKGKGGKKKRR
ncbi:hypothetical protein H696_03687 [Fonticula alba]|uniref:Signal recognition particle subunit SRP72 n=1 Tax=Fonticula alba TaxID=691883 RepID=A0A058Z4Q7_FONAL|nr:hypothetical protein H696_03687 [Fonticula alba]KCV69260.1 hypothetical protein H696_03687 [Fonticula alba]|eukprot:XP_009495825.1 hypothetical protein H696_03687 [Fonticula alba]